MPEWIDKIKSNPSIPGIVLFISAILALIVTNTSLSPYYHHFLETPFAISLATFKMQKPLLLWINEGLMAIFFFHVSLEIKYAMVHGELNSWDKSSLPAIAALGGMIVPALIYFMLNYNDVNAYSGWAIPTATDIAFSLGILSLLGKGVPHSLRIFLLALAIYDDLGAIAIIGGFYSDHISYDILIYSLLICSLFVLYNRINIVSFSMYFVTGLVLWTLVLKSGVHATLAGVVVGLALPICKNPNEIGDKTMARKIYNKLSPWVNYLILPVFAFANAGVTLPELSSNIVLSPVLWGIVLGLFLGKQIGIMLFAYIAVKSRIASLPTESSWIGLYAVSLLCGVGFTMSLFIGTLAFEDIAGLYTVWMRMGVLFGSFISGLIGYLVLYQHIKLKPR